MTRDEAAQLIVDAIDNIELGTYQDSAAWVLGVILSQSDALGLAGVRDAWARLAGRRACG